MSKLNKAITHVFVRLTEEGDIDLGQRASLQGREGGREGGEGGKGELIQSRPIICSPSNLKKELVYQLLCVLV